MDTKEKSIIYTDILQKKKLGVLGDVFKKTISSSSRRRSGNSASIDTRVNFEFRLELRLQVEKS